MMNTKGFLWARDFCCRFHSIYVYLLRWRCSIFFLLFFAFCKLPITNVCLKLHLDSRVKTYLYPRPVRRGTGIAFGKRTYQFFQDFDFIRLVETANFDSMIILLTSFLLFPLLEILVLQAIQGEVVQG